MAGFIRLAAQAAERQWCVAEHWPTFQERAAAQGGLPKFAVKEFEEYLGCGCLDRGCLRLVCRGGRQRGTSGA